MNAVAATAGFDRLFTDERLTRRAVGGDERAFAAIFRRYHQPLYRFCLALVGNPEDAQDALQNTMAKVLRALPGEKRKIELKPWLYRIAHNESIDLLRRRRQTRELDVEQVAPGYGLAEEAATRERLRRLLTDLRELPERQREVLVMRELAGLGFEEIGAALETSDAVARQTLYEARQSLRQMEEGREMNCDLVTRALSDGDGRVTRRRDVRAHLRTCAGCRGFRGEMENRERSFAALSPLPAVAAAGMLQGLLGGSQIATGGGLAAMLGGGAAKTVGASAAAKGVATAAVVAAVGVGAADRTGVIHVGLPGEGGAKSSEAAPGAAGAAPDPHVHVGHGHAAPGGAKGGAAGGDGSESAAGAQGSGPPHAASPAAEGEAPPAAVDAQGLESHPARSPQADSKAQGPPLEHPQGKGRAEHPAAAAPGQETAAEQAPAVPEIAGEKGVGGDKGTGGGEGRAPVEKGDPPANTPKAAPASPPGSPPASPPGASPPGARPEGQPQPPGPPSSPPKAEPPAKPAAPPAPASPGKGAGAEAGEG